jgi:hypothetical protein
MTDIDPFAEDPIERDDYGSPLILQADGTTIAYTRASSLGAYLTDDRFVLMWKLRMLAKALGLRPDLADKAAIEPYTTGFAEPEQAIKSASGKRLDALIEQALDHVLINERADRGTVVHAVTEQDYEGYVPHTVITELAAFNEWMAINNVRRVGSEIFVVNDDLRVAGTFDHLLWHEHYGLIIGDTKNGRNTNALGFGCQFANYGRSFVYDSETGERTSLPDYVKREYGFDPGPVNQKWALLLSLKAAENGGYGELKVSEVDIEWGYEKCELAAAVRDSRKQETGKVLQSKILKHVKGKKAKDLAQAALLARLGAAASRDELKVIWKHYQPIWNDALTEASKARVQELGALAADHDPLED